MFSKITLSSKLTIVLLLILAVFFADLRYKQYQQQKAIGAEEESLTQQADALQKKNDDLNQSLSYLNSDSFKERVARQQLDLKKDGEVVYNFSTAANTTTTVPLAQANTKSNTQKWWDYFTNSTN